MLAPFAAEQDKAEREQRKEQRKAERKAESAQARETRKALKAEQQQARIDYANGKICMEQFATIMAKTA